MFHKIFSDHLFKLIMPVLTSEKLSGKPKIFILQHCRGTKWMFLATDGIDDETAKPINNDQPCHLLEDCIFVYSTAEGNPAIRNKVGSNFIQVSINSKYQRLHENSRQCVFMFNFGLGIFSITQ